MCCFSFSIGCFRIRCYKGFLERVWLQRVYYELVSLKRPEVPYIFIKTNSHFVQEFPTGHLSNSEQNSVNM